MCPLITNFLFFVFVCLNDSDIYRQFSGKEITFSLFFNRKPQQTRTCSEASVSIGLFGIQSKGPSHSCWWMLQWAAWYGLQWYSLPYTFTLWKEGVIIIIIITVTIAIMNFKWPSLEIFSILNFFSPTL